MRSEQGSATIVWIVILLALLATMAFLAVDRRALVAKLEAAQDAVAKLEAKIEEKPEKTKTTIHELTAKPDPTRVQFEEERLQSNAALENEQELCTRLATCSKELQAKKQDCQKLSASLTELHSNVRSLVQALKQSEVDRELYEKRAADAEKKAGQFEKQAQTLGNEVARLTRNKQELQKDVAHFKKLVETAARAGCTWPQVIVDRVVMNGTVQSVNTKDRSVVLSLGRDDKVVRGLLFYISRDGAYVGRVRVNHVEPKTCSARIVQIEDNMTIRPGDQASTKPFVR